MSNNKVELKDTKQYKAALKLLGDPEVIRIIGKTKDELKESIAANASFIQRQKTIMEESDKYKAAQETLKECRSDFKELTKDSKAALDLAVLVLSEEE